MRNDEQCVEARRNVNILFNRAMPPEKAKAARALAVAHIWRDEATGRRIVCYPCFWYFQGKEREKR